MNNPYEVLGIPEYATEEQIKSAYRELARKYGDENAGAGIPAQFAHRKMQEINEAYDQIITNRGASSGGPRAQSAYYNGYSDYRDIREKINSGRIEDAQTQLDGIPPSARDAQWYFLKGNVQDRRGWLEEAFKNYSTACNMDPGNPEYRAAFDAMNRSRSGGYATQKQNDTGCSGCDICTGLLCTYCCCECMGGDFIPCC